MSAIYLSIDEYVSADITSNNSVKANIECMLYLLSLIIKPKYLKNNKCTQIIFCNKPCHVFYL